MRAFSERGETEAALALIDRSLDTTLGEVRRLFADLRALARQQHREIAMVLMARGRTFSAIVEKVLSAERFPAFILEPDHLIETDRLDALAGAGV